MGCVACTALDIIKPRVTSGIVIANVDSRVAFELNRAFLVLQFERVSR